MTFDDFYDYLLNLCDKLSHRVDEQEKTIEDYQNEIERLTELIDIRDDACIDFSDEIKRLEKENTNLRKNIERTAKQTREINALYKEIEQQKTEINRLKMIIDLKDDARIELVKENKELQRKFDDTTNDYKLASCEMSVLNKYIDKLTAENNDLKFRFNMFKKVCLNSIYGITGTKHTDSIKEGGTT